MKDNCDRLVEEHESVFPDDWEYQDIVNFACRYTISNIDDIEGIFEEDEENE